MKYFTVIASASLAQVHTAICKETGKKLAIKVQHKGLRETSKGDLLAMSTVVMLADQLFEDFKVVISIFRTCVSLQFCIYV